MESLWTLSPTWWLALAVVAVTVGFQFLVSLGGPAETRTRRDLHLRRKAQHALTGLAFVGVYERFVEDSLAVTILLVCAAVFFVLHRVRLAVPRFNAWVLASFAPILRSHEREQLPGAFWFLLGSAGVIAAFPKFVAQSAILVLAFGDPAASLTGVLLRGDASTSAGREATKGRAIEQDEGRDGRGEGAGSDGPRRRTRAGAEGKDEGRQGPAEAGPTTQPEGKSFIGAVGCFVASSLVVAGYLLATGEPFGVGEGLGMAALVALTGAGAALAEAVTLGGLDDNLTLPILVGAWMQWVAIPASRMVAEL